MSTTNKSMPPWYPLQFPFLLQAPVFQIMLPQFPSWFRASIPSHFVSTRLDIVIREIPERWAPS